MPVTECDVLVVGAGPAGIAAAVTAAEAGRQVAVVDDGAFPGGQIWRNRGESPASRIARRWFARLAAEKSIVMFRQSRVVANPQERALLIETSTGSRLIRWSSLILATGARERFIPFPGWTLPGVIGAGGLQALVKQGLEVRGMRIVIAGTGPLLLAVADLLRSQGAIVPLILEQAPATRINRFARSLIRSPKKLATAIVLRSRLIRTRYATGSYPLRAASVDGRLRLDFRTPAGDEAIDCDYLGCGFHLIPNTELPQLLGCELTGDGFVRVDSSLRTTQPSIYAVGEQTGIAGVDKAIIEGCLAAGVIGGDPGSASQFAAEHQTAQAFARQLAEVFALRPELFQLASPGTILCRCEDVPLSAVQDCKSGRDAKLQTRCGMGPCQGRVCGPMLQRLFPTEPLTVRPPIHCTSVATLAGGFPIPMIQAAATPQPSDEK